MDLDVIEKRIQILERYKDQLDEKIAATKHERTEIEGAIKEMWRFHEKNLEVHEFGGISYDGQNKIYKLPKFGSPEAVEKGISERLDAQVAGDEEIARAARVDRAKHDAQKAVDKIDDLNKAEQEN